MYAVLGATGKVGDATIRSLREAGQPVRAVIRDRSKAERYLALGCEVAVADFQDVPALVSALSGAAHVQVICPPVPDAADAPGAMRATIDSIAETLTEARPRITLAISDYGAHIPSGTGITVLFHELEKKLAEVPTRPIFLRSAEHMENWARLIPVAAQTGRLPSLHHPLSKRFPTISAADLGRISATLLLREHNSGGDPLIIHAEGPERYSATDIADVLTPILGRDVSALELPRAAWHQTLLGAGLSDSGAGLVTELYDVHNQGLIDVEAGAGEILRGSTDPAAAFKDLLDNTRAA